MTRPSSKVATSLSSILLIWFMLFDWLNARALMDNKEHIAIKERIFFEVVMVFNFYTKDIIKMPQSQILL